MRPSAAVLAAARSTKQGPSDDKLQAITARARDARNLAQEIAVITERLGEKKKQQTELLTKTLPDMMQEVGLRNFTLEREGNHPAFQLKIAPYIHANIVADWPDEKKEAAFGWLIRNGLGDMIKNILTIQFGRGTMKQQRAVEAALRKLKVPYSSDRGVPWNTLTAWVREAIEKGQEVPLELLGATVGTVAKLTEVKEK